jgi:hypothetical protein
VLRKSENPVSWMLMANGLATLLIRKLMF